VNTIKIDAIPKQPIMNKNALMQRRIVAMQNHTLEVDTFKILRTKILKQLKTNNWNSFGITAPTKNAGKTLISANLAMVMAKELNQTILLVDMDLRNPNVHWYFDIKVTTGLKDCIISNKPLLDALISPSLERLFILPGRDRVTESSELITAPKMQHLVAEFKNYFQPQITIFDLPPILEADDVLASMDYYDAMLLIVEDGVNKPDEVKNSLKMLSGINLLGTVLNKSNNT
jgi:capsular exopolysaccharide synthesis family protein